MKKPTETENAALERVELKKEPETAKPSSLKEVDNEFKQLDNLEKEL